MSVTTRTAERGAAHPAPRRIAHEAAVRALEHVLDVVEVGGGRDGAIPRPDAAALLAELRHDGRALEALALEGVLRVLDGRAAAGGAPSPAIFDLGSAQGFPREEMPRRFDPEGEGYDRRKIAAMSPPGRALVELGFALELRRRAAPAAKPAIYVGLDRVADLAGRAAREDRTLSRAARGPLLDGLAKQGRGIEALAVEALFRLADRREESGRAPRAGTDVDIDAAIAFAAARALDRRDERRLARGIPRTEVETLSAEARAFLLLGEGIDAGLL